MTPPPGWFQVANNAAERIAEVGASAWMIYTLLCRHADADRRCWPSLTRLADLSGLKRRTIQVAVRRLTEAGWIEVELLDGKGNTYTLPPIEPAQLDAPVHEDAPEGRTRMRGGAHVAARTGARSCARTRTKNKTNEGKARTSRKQFVPPSLEQVRAYCKERGNSVDPEAWMDHYIANGWKVGKSAMVDWKAAVRTWERNDYSKANGNGRHTAADDAPTLFAN